jgi:F-type H+-transporting ATPase subunit beta
VKIEDTVRSFREIIEGKHDDIPERAFLLKGTIDQVVEAAGGAREEEAAERVGGEGEEQGEPAGASEGA